jgi:hypothetical protein
MDNWDMDLKVANMDDGMGSLLLIPKGQNNKNRLFKKQISDVIFKDIDNIDVIVSLYTDQDGFLFELDVWKVNFEPVIELDRFLYNKIP